jgi:predicted nucleic acid-binding protein
MLSRAFALRANATVYDALYIALAEGLDARFLTRDAALATLPGHRARVEVID